ncbi:hypothetical protein [Spirosoma utsteinense]|uniref:Uncharacterized protein n=1 Tax=Spirosoma utsteinense TaxID=2585773 RepID=A0ABR6W787_9BACT|nr:hypothetical protein [Spirosoma utsteinense]MBC3785651.1 hypothetical protein [Spirosoma utsteinense]MBC3791802.1 hypothetical protein [Spirosoma utsteinense]
MKQRIPFSICLIALATLSFIAPPNPLVGRWQHLYKGATALFVFRADSTFDVFINGKAFTHGTYFVRKDTMGMADVSCNLAYYGTYKMGFYAPDSVRFNTIADTCKGRNGDLHNFSVGRVSPDRASKAKP